jgi:hypothetical protein
LQIFLEVVEVADLASVTIAVSEICAVTVTSGAEFDPGRSGSRRDAA